VGKDARLEFTAHNYGTTTTSETEYLFVAAPTRDSLNRIGRSSWPVERKLADNAETRRLCRRARPMKYFEEARKELSEKLKAIRMEFTDDHFIGARLYTGPTFVKYNTVLRAMPGKTPYFVKLMETLTLGNKYSTTLHVISAALTTLSSMSKCQYVYRGVAGGILPEQFTTPSDEDNFRGGVEYGFMSTTSNREVAVTYAKGGNGLVFEMWMGMADKGADLTFVSQYPHEAEICFPPLTALEVRGYKTDNSLTIIDVDARINASTVNEDTDMAADIRSFRAQDKDGSGELDRVEFGHMARQIVPKISEEALDRVFLESDMDQSGHISFTEYCTACVPRLRREEARAAKREVQESQHERESELRQVYDFMAEQAERTLKKELAKQAEKFRKLFQQKVSDELLLQRKAVAELAAEMMLHHGLDRAAPSATRSRKLSKLTKAIESTALPQNTINERAGGELAAETQRRARAKTPRAKPAASPRPRSAATTPRSSSRSPRVMTSRLDLQNFTGTPRYRPATDVAIPGSAGTA